MEKPKPLLATTPIMKQVKLQKVLIMQEMLPPMSMMKMETKQQLQMQKEEGQLTPTMIEAT